MTIFNIQISEFQRPFITTGDKIKWIFFISEHSLAQPVSLHPASAEGVIVWAPGVSVCMSVCVCLSVSLSCLDRVGTLSGFQSIVWTFVRHTVSRCLIFPVLPEVTKLTHVASSSSCLRVNMGCALAIAFQVRSLYVPNMARLPFKEPVSGSP